jgi:inner membrane protein
MTGKTHILGGALASLGIAKIAGLSPRFHELVSHELIPFIVGSMIGSLLPDIDHPNSLISRKFPVIAAWFSMDRRRKRRKARNFFLSDEEREEANIVYRDASHRGRTHYLLPWVIVLGVSTMLYLMNSYFFKSSGIFWTTIIGAGIGVGAVSHILLDMVSGKVPAFAPFCRKSFGMRLFKVNGLMEVIVLRLLLLIGCVNLVLILLQVV